MKQFFVVCGILVSTVHCCARSTPILSVAKLKEKIEHARLESSQQKTTIQEILEGARHKKVTSNKLAALLNELDNLRWSHDHLFVTTLQESYNKSPHDARNWLFERLVALYPQERFPLVTFMCELQKEYEFFNKSLAGLFTLMDKKLEKEPISRETIQYALDKIGVLKHTLVHMMIVVNDILSH